MPTLSPRLAQRVRSLLEGFIVVCEDPEVREHVGHYAHDARALLARWPKAAPKKVPLRGPSIAAKRTAKKKAHRLNTSEVRRLVWERSQGLCENPECLRGLYSGGELDHFRGGTSRRKLTTLENCWRLCRGCHQAKTENNPSRMHWLLRFQEHRDRAIAWEQQTRTEGT